MLITTSETTFTEKPRLVFDQTANYHGLAKSTHIINLCSHQDSLFFCINAELLTAQSSRGDCVISLSSCDCIFSFLCYSICLFSYCFLVMTNLTEMNLCIYILLLLKNESAIFHHLQTI